MEMPNEATMARSNHLLSGGRLASVSMSNLIRIVLFYLLCMYIIVKNDYRQVVPITREHYSQWILHMGPIILYEKNNYTACGSHCFSSATINSGFSPLPVTTVINVHHHPFALGIFLYLLFFPATKSG